MLTIGLATTALRAPLIVPASNFEHELGYRTFTATTYSGAPLALLDTTTRAKVLTAFARRRDSELHPGATFADAEAGEGVDGRRLGTYMASYRWQRDTRRVACRTAALQWDGNSPRWELRFSEVKLPAAGARDAAFDELQLLAYTPEGVHLFRHDLRAGVSTTGKRTASAGHNIKFFGPRNEPDWRVALGEILGKMREKGCTPLESVSFDDPRLAAAIAETPMPMSTSVYEGVPLTGFGAKARGDVLRRMVRRLDEGWLHKGATFEEPLAGRSVDGKRRAQNNAEYGWQRDGRRVACKSAGLGWSRANGWQLGYTSVRLPVEDEHGNSHDAAFDELLLAAYTPEGVHVLRHDLRAGVSTRGKRTAATGQQIKFYGSKDEPSWRAALGEILRKMEDRGCKPLAFVPWDDQ